MAREVNLKVGIDARQAGTGAKQFKRASQSLISDSKSVGKSFANLGSDLSALAAGFAGLKIVRDATQAFIEQEKAVNQLEAILKSTGNVVGRTSEQLQDLASSLQSVTTFGDEAIIESEKLLLTFKSIRGEIFDRTIPAILDLSQTFGTDLRQQTIQVAKALEDPIKGLFALSRTGITFSENQKEVIKQLVETNKVAEAQIVILEALESQSKGAAEAYRNTFGGSVQALKNAFGDLLEVITGVAVETTEAINKTQSLETRIVKITDSITENIEKIKLFTSTVGVIFNTFAILTSNVGKLIVKIFKNIVDDFLIYGEILITIIKQSVIAGFNFILISINKIRNKIIEKFQDVLSGIANVFEALDDYSFEFIDKLVNKLDKLKSSKNNAKELENVFKSFSENTSKSFEKASLQSSKLQKLISQQSKLTIDEFSKVFADYQKKLEDFNLGTTEIIGKTVDDSKIKIKELKFTLEEVLFTSRNLVKSWGDDAADVLTDFVTTGKRGFRELTQSILTDLLRLQIRNRLILPLEQGLNNLFERTFTLPTFGKTNISGGGSIGTGISGGASSGAGISSTSGFKLSLGSQRPLAPTTNITVNNNTNAQVETRTSVNAQGEEQIELIIQNAVKTGFNNGSFDNELAQFNVSRGF